MRGKGSVRRGYWIPCLILGLLLAGAVWNSRTLNARIARWTAQLDRTEGLAAAERWAEVRAVLAQSEAEWQTSRTYLHIVCRHDAAGGAEELYHRCLSLAQTQERSAFLEELTALRDQLASLGEMERLSLGNIL